MTTPSGRVLDAIAVLQAEGYETWFCNSVLAPRCTEESHESVVGMFEGHTSCQRVVIAPLEDSA